MAHINWTRSSSGATYTGVAGEQRFFIMPDGCGCWLLLELDITGRAHLLEHSRPSDWSAMAAALSYVHAPIRWPLRLLVAAVAIHALAAL